MKLSSLISVAVLNISVLSLVGCQAVSTDTDSSKEIVTTAIEASQLDSDKDGVPDINDECPNTPPYRVVDEKGCIVIVSDFTDTLELEMTVFFAPLSSQLLEDYNLEFVKTGKKLKEFPKAHVFIFGHVSSKERDVISRSGALSIERGLVIKNILVERQNIAPERISIYDCSDRLRMQATASAMADRNIESPNSRVTIRASNVINDLNNITGLAVTSSYEKFSQHCDLVNN